MPVCLELREKKGEKPSILLFSLKSEVAPLPRHESEREISKLELAGERPVFNRNRGVDTSRGMDALPRLQWMGWCFSGHNLAPSGVRVFLFIPGMTGTISKWCFLGAYPGVSKGRIQLSLHQQMIILSMH